MSNWYQNLDDKLIRECDRFKLIKVVRFLVVKKTQIDKKHIDIKRNNKEEMEGVNDNVFMMVHSCPEILKKNS